MSCFSVVLGDERQPPASISLAGQKKPGKDKRDNTDKKNTDLSGLLAFVVVPGVPGVLGAGFSAYDALVPFRCLSRNSRVAW
jgi:hypothetical protein